MSKPDDKFWEHGQLDWLSACRWLQQNGQPYCIVTIVAEIGSLPRSSGSKMVVSRAHQYDTIGGGALEFEAIKTARQCLAEKQTQPSIKRFALAADLGQCCGGASQLMFECMQVSQPNVVIYGAGHVSRALSTILKELPCQLRVIDSREDWLDSIEKLGVSTQFESDPVVSLGQIELDSHLVIMTHDHQLDYQLTLNALTRNCFSSIGLIASKSKKQRFETRLREQLPDQRLLDKLNCPIGNPSIRGKLPMQVAVSIAAQLIELFNQQPTVDTDHTEVWAQANALRKQGEVQT